MEKAQENMDNRPIIDGLQIPEKQVLQKGRGKVKSEAMKLITRGSKRGNSEEVLKDK